MRRSALALAALALLSVASPALADSLAVKIDQSVGLSLTSSARDVMVGNPAIADVQVIDSRHLLVMGKAYGVTNLVVIDTRGRTLVNQQVVVSAPDENRISMYRGPDVYNFACSPRCERTPMPGEPDTGGVYSKWGAPYVAYADKTKTAAETAAKP